MAKGLQEEDFGLESQNLKFPRPDSKLIVLLFFLAGLFVLAIGAGLFLFKHKGTSDDVQILSANASGSPANSISQIVVDIDRLPADSRVGDAVKAAGGLTADSDSTKVNLAAKVSDGQKIHVPALSEQVTSQSNLISINTATAAELDTLPGVGPVTAQKIISSRPYSSLEDLVSKKAVNKSTFEKIKELVAL